MATEQDITEPSGKRENYIKKEDYYMAIAKLSEERSKDKDTQVGACVVNTDDRIVAIGYNGMPNRCDDDRMPWRKEEGLKDKRLYVCHAELNAICNKHSTNVRDCTLYVTLFPCNECSKVIVQSGIKEVVYLSDRKSQKNEVKASKFILANAGINARRYKPLKDEIRISLIAEDRDTDFQ